MKYIMPICNMIGALLLGYVIVITVKHLVTLDTGMEAFVQKYKVEDATQCAYMAEVYHKGNWPVILTDCLAAEDGIQPSDSARSYEATRLSLAISFEETVCNYLVAYDNTITTVVIPYTLVETPTRILLSSIDLDSGTMIDKDTGNSFGINSRADLRKYYADVTGKQYDDDILDQHLELALSASLNKIIADAMSSNGYSERDTVYIPYKQGATNLNTIRSQTMLVLGTSNRAEAVKTTLAGYSKTEKRQWCTFYYSGVLCYGLNKDLPSGCSIVQLYDVEKDAARNSKGAYFVKKQ